MVDFKNLREIAKNDPSRIALIHKDSHLTYEELWKRSEALGWYLHENSNTKHPVAIIGDKENDMVSSIFGSIKAAKPYVVIPSYYPEERLFFILKDSDADFIINVSSRDIDTDIRTVSINDINNMLVNYAKCDDLKVAKNPDDTALLMYTSGSTGTPKGVVLTYRNFEAKIKSTADVYAESCKKEHHIEINLASYAFSASYGFPFFLDEGGASYICVSKDVLMDYTRLFDYLKDEKATGFFSTPALLRQLLSIDDFNERVMPSIHTLWIGGDVFTIELYKQLRSRFPKARILNGYGMTECLACGMTHVVTDKDIENQEDFIAVGDVGNGQFFLMDEKGERIIEDGKVGEIIMYGDCVGKGYNNLPKQTEEKFFKLEDGTPAFRTGDSAKFHNGQVFFLGRADFQVKIGGNRIELPEVEAAIRKTSLVADCAVAVRKSPTNSLVAFVVLNDEGLKMKNMAAFLEIKKEMKQYVESFMIPEKFKFIDQIPHNINSKIDRVLLNEWAQN